MTYSVKLVFIRIDKSSCRVVEKVYLISQSNKTIGCEIHSYLKSVCMCVLHVCAVACMYVCFSKINLLLNPIQGWGTLRPPPTSFFPVTPTKHFLTLVLIFLQRCYKISRPFLVPTVNYWTWTMTTHQKNFFCQILIKLKLQQILS